MENLLILTGPTGIGKTELSLSIAEDLNTEIISADSMQIYKYMDIGTAKIDLSSTKIKHHLIDIINPNDEYSVNQFQNESIKIINDLNNQKKVPMVVGGTGLYINSLIYDLSFQEIPKDIEYRNFLEKLSLDKGVNHIYNLLYDKDPKRALNIDKNNKNRIIRSLEILHNGGNIEEDSFRKENNSYNLLFIGLNMDRNKLYEQINFRVDKMIELGLVDEVRNLLNLYPDKELNAYKAIGYKEVISYIDNNISFDEMVDLIKKNSRHYAKRQLTWFRRDSRIVWLDKEDSNLKNKINDLIGEKFGKLL